MPSHDNIPCPVAPSTLDETGLPESLIEQLLLKILYFRGELYGQDLSTAIGLRFSVIQEIVEALKLSHHLQVKRSMGMGNVGSVFALTESGRELARQYLESNQYSGPAPVPAEQYTEIVRRQRQRDGWLTQGSARQGLPWNGAHRIHPQADRSGRQRGQFAAALWQARRWKNVSHRIAGQSRYRADLVPYAIECQGNIVQVFDPIYHHLIEEEPAESTEGVVNCFTTHRLRPALGQMQAALHRERRRIEPGDAGPALQPDVEGLRSALPVEGQQRHLPDRRLRTAARHAGRSAQSLDRSHGAAPGLSELSHRRQDDACRSRSSWSFPPI